jgi:hypothetical protein
MARSQMSDPTSTERLAEILWTARKRALGDHDDKPFSQASPRIRKQYAKEAEQVAKLLGRDRAKVEYLGAEISSRSASHAVALDQMQTMALTALAERDEAQGKATFLTEVMARTVLLGADDAIGMVRALTQNLTGTEVIDPDQARQVIAGLDKQQADQDGLAEQRDQARMAVDRAEKLAEEAADARTTVAPRALPEAVADVAQLCPDCWRIHGLWCHPYGGPMAVPDPAAHQHALDRRATIADPAAQRDSARAPDAGT